MSFEADLSPEFRSLLDAVFDGECDSDQLARLESLLVSDPETRRAYVEYMSTIADVRRYLRGQPKFLQIDPAEFDAVSQVQEPARIPVLGFLGGRYRSSSAFAYAAAVLVLGTCALATYAWLPRNSATGTPSVSTQSAIVARPPVKASDRPAVATLPPGDANEGDPIIDEIAEDDDADMIEPVFIARVTASHNAQWDGTEPANERPSLLAVGQTCQLSAGLLEIKFDNGARVLLEGPAELVLNSSRQATLIHGQLTAQIPPQAIGFTIQTPSVNVVDLGTEFGVRVNSQGTTDVAVFSGEVVAEPRGSAATPGQEVHVVADDVRRFASDNANEDIMERPRFTFSIPKEIAIENPSFESPHISSWMKRSINGWIVSSKPELPGIVNAGVQLVTKTRLQFPKPTDGEQWAFLETRRLPTGEIHRTSMYQAVGELTPATQYQLQAMLGRERFIGDKLTRGYPISPDPKLDIGLWSGKSKEEGPLHPLEGLVDSSQTEYVKDIAEVSRVFRTPKRLLGDEKILFIRIAISGDDWSRALIDHVRLDAMSIESPSSDEAKN